MKEKAIQLLKELTQAHGAPSCEDEVRHIFKKYIHKDYLTDHLGSIYAHHKGTKKVPKIMVAGHLDEVGLMVHSITHDGFIRFIPLGGFGEHVLLAQRVRIQTQNQKEIIGVISSKPTHFLSADELSKVVSIDKMVIDVGAKDKMEVENDFKINVGDTIVPESPFIQMKNPDMFMAKAFDNRNGVGLAIQLSLELENIQHPNSIFCGANAQEEVGTRGAQTAAQLIQPDLAIIVEGSPADDVPGFASDERQGVLGSGIQIRIMDSGSILNQKFTRFAITLAKKNKIAHQVAVRKKGATDARAIHLHNLGVPSIVLGVPTRYIHTHNSIININDYLSGLKLLIELVKSLNQQKATEFKTF